MRRLHRLLLPALGVLLAASCAPLADPATQARNATLQRLGYTPMPLQRVARDKRYSGQFLVNGVPVRFLIDSGANSTDLDLELALRVGIRPDPKMKVVSRGALGRPVTSQVGMGALTAGDYRWGR